MAAMAASKPDVGVADLKQEKTVVMELANPTWQEHQKEGPGKGQEGNDGRVGLRSFPFVTRALIKTDLCAIIFISYK